MADSDDIDVKAEGRGLINRQQQAMRDTAEDEDYARKRRTEKGWSKKQASSREMLDLTTTEPSSPERKGLMRRDEYLIKTTADDKAKAKPSSFAKGGMVMKTGMAKVHRGEKVLTKTQVSTSKSKPAAKMSTRKRISK